MTPGKKSLILFFVVAGGIAIPLFLFADRWAYTVTAEGKQPLFEVSVRWRIVESIAFGSFFGGAAALVAYLWWARREIIHRREQR